MAKAYVCDKHGTEQSAGQYCPACMTAFENRRDAATMTAEERAVEFEWWGDILTIPSGSLHQRITELVGRDVWTHELADPKSLIAEIRNQHRATVDDVLNKIPGDKRIVIIDAS